MCVKTFLFYSPNGKGTKLRKLSGLSFSPRLLNAEVTASRTKDSKDWPCSPKMKAAKITTEIIGLSYISAKDFDLIRFTMYMYLHYYTYCK